ncbi:hypothetical protein Tco_0444990 [Tanacetum coccineum]
MYESNYFLQSPFGICLVDAARFLKMVPHLRRLIRHITRYGHGQAPKLSLLKESGVVMSFVKISWILKASEGSVEDIEVIQDEDTTLLSTRTRRPTDRLFCYIGFSQYEVDNEETFSPVAHIRAIRISLAIAAFYDYEIGQSGCQTASLWTFSEESIMRATEELRVSCYTDAGYLTDADNLKSQTGYVFVLNGGDVDWKSTKQSIFSYLLKYANILIAAVDARKSAAIFQIMAEVASVRVGLREVSDADECCYQLAGIKISKQKIVGKNLKPSNLVKSVSGEPPGSRALPSFKPSACSLSTLHFLKFPENSFEVLKILENSVEVLTIIENKLESMKILENKLESLKLQENQPVDGLVPPSTQKNYIRKCFREAVKE